MKYTIIIFLLTLISPVFAQSTIKGKVTDAKTGEPILFGTVVVYQDGELIRGTETDFDGNYQIDSLATGMYDIEAAYTGYTASRITGVLAKEAEVVTLDITIQEGLLPSCVVKSINIPIIEQDAFQSGQIYNKDQIRRFGN